MGKKVRKNSVYYCKQYAAVVLVILCCCMFQACSKKLPDQRDGASSNLLVTNQPDNALSKEPSGDTTSITKLPDTALTLTPQEKTTYIKWNDKELEALIREVIHKPEGEILTKEVENIKDLCIVSRTLINEEFSEDGWNHGYFGDLENYHVYNIQDWSDLSYLKNLEHLVLYGNDITDIGFLKSLNKITFLNIMGNEIEDFQPLSGLTSLHQLYIDRSYMGSELLFLLDLPIESSNINMARIYYPFQFSTDDCVEGITAGNLVNTGFVAYDGENLYTMDTGWGDLAHGSLIRYQVETGKINGIECVITEQMAKLWKCEPGGYINERVNSLNYYKDHLYYISRGTNNDTAGPGEEDYYYGDETFGIIRYNVTTEERKLLTTERFQYLCVARDHIYGVNEKNEFVRMSLEGKDRTLVVKEPCSLAYVNDEVIYYLTAGKKTKLMQMKEESEKPQLILEGDIVNPILQGNYVYYMDASSYLYRYNITTKDKVKICKYPILSYNLDSNNIYALSETTGVCRMKLDGSNMTILSDSYMAFGSIQVVGDYLFIGPSPYLWKIKKDGTGYNEFFEYY